MCRYEQRALDGCPHRGRGRRDGRHVKESIWREKPAGKEGGGEEEAWMGYPGLCAGGD